MRNPKTPANMRAEAARLRAYADRLTAEADRASANAPGAFVTGRSGRSWSMDKRTERALEKTIDNAKKSVEARKRADWLEAVAADIEFGGPEKRRLARYKAREKEITRGRAERKAMREGELKDRLGIYAFPAGYVYADKAVEVMRDYRRLGFLSYESLILEIDQKCPAYWRDFIIDSARETQMAAGEQKQISRSGQTIRLGTSKPGVLRSRFFAVPGDDRLWFAPSYDGDRFFAAPVIEGRLNQWNKSTCFKPALLRQLILDFEEEWCGKQPDPEWPILTVGNSVYPRLAYIEARVKE